MNVQLFDSTLRDGTQSEGLSLSVEDKLKIARLLDGFGIHYIEGGYPGSNPKDVEFFQRAKSVTFRHAKLTAFGMTRKPGGRADSDPILAAMVAAETPAVAVVGKTWTLHVTKIVGTTLEENLAMVADSVAFLKQKGREVVFDCEHFFDGFRADRGLRAGGGQGRLGRRRRLDRDVRHQRRQPARDHHRGGRRGQTGGPHAARHSHAQRLRRGGRQRLRRDRGRLHPGAGDDERLGRAVRQRQPDLGHRRPAAEDGPALRAGGEPGAPHRAVARGQRDRQHPPARARPLRRSLGVRAQGGDARRRGGEDPRQLRAHRPRAGRQPAPHRRLRAVGARQRPHARRGAGDRRAGERKAPSSSTSRSWRARDTSSRRPRARSSCSDDAASRATSPPSRSSTWSSSRSAAAATRCSPRRP